MLSTETISELRELSKDLTVLYVEDNEKLRNKAYAVLKKLLTKVLCASDGEEGYALFKEHRPEIVITDIKMPKLDGLGMIKQIKQIEPSTKLIITSAFDDKEYLLKAIELGIFNYINKPVKIDNLVDTLVRCINSISSDENSGIFNTYMHEMIEYSNDPLALMSKDEPLFVNQNFLDFFNLDNLDEFFKKYKNFGELLLPHKGFIYNIDDSDWFSQVLKDLKKLYHVKIEDQEGSNRHFILKIQKVPNKDDMYIMSLSDITELNLLPMFDSSAVEKDDEVKTRTTINNLMKVMQKNSGDIKIHNFYKGLTITNLASVVEIDDEYLVIKVPMMQQRAIQHQKNILMTSEIFPTAVYCDSVSDINFSNQTVTIKKMRFLPSNPSQRSTVRVFPEEHHTVSLFVEERKFFGELRIYDISVEAVKLELNALPAGLNIESNIVLNMVLEQDRKPLIIHVPAKVFRIDEVGRSYFIVVKLDAVGDTKKLLIGYVAKRQMDLIREFKGL